MERHRRRCRFHLGGRSTGHLPAAGRQRPDARLRVRRRGARLHDGLRHHPAHQLRPRRGGDDRLHGRLLGDRARSPAAACRRCVIVRPRHRCGGAGVHGGGLHGGAHRLPPAAQRAAPGAADHRDRRVDHPAAPGAARLEPQHHRLPADHRAEALPPRQRRNSAAISNVQIAIILTSVRDDGGPAAAGVPHQDGHRDARHLAEPAGRGPDGRGHQPRDLLHLRDRRGARRGGRRDGRHATTASRTTRWASCSG